MLSRAPSPHPSPAWSPQILQMGSLRAARGLSLTQGRRCQTREKVFLLASESFLTQCFGQPRPRDCSQPCTSNAFTQLPQELEPGWPGEVRRYIPRKE